MAVSRMLFHCWIRATTALQDELKLTVANEIRAAWWRLAFTRSPAFFAPEFARRHGRRCCASCPCFPACVFAAPLRFAPCRTRSASSVCMGAVEGRRKLRGWRSSWHPAGARHGDALVDEFWSVPPLCPPPHLQSGTASAYAIQYNWVKIMPGLCRVRILFRG